MQLNITPITKRQEESKLVDSFNVQNREMPRKEMTKYREQNTETFPI